jgi:hypothetical protein
MVKMFRIKRFRKQNKTRSEDCSQWTATNKTQKCPFNSSVTFRKNRLFVVKTQNQIYFFRFSKNYSFSPFNFFLTLNIKSQYTAAVGTNLWIGINCMGYFKEIAERPILKLRQWWTLEWGNKEEKKRDAISKRMMRRGGEKIPPC